MGALEKKPGVQNWIEKLPAGMRAAWNRSIIYRAAVHMHRERGMPVGKAIASAINWCKHVAATGDVKQWPGPQSVNPRSVAECRAALALWEAMKAAARSETSITAADVPAIELAAARRPGLVAVKVRVTNRKGTTFERTMYVRPRQAKQLERAKGTPKLSKQGARVTREQSAVLGELGKIPAAQRPDGWQDVVRTLADPRHGGRLGPEKRRLLRRLEKSAPDGSPLKAAVAGALKADAASPADQVAKRTSKALKEAFGQGKPKGAATRNDAKRTAEKQARGIKPGRKRGKTPANIRIPKPPGRKEMAAPSSAERRRAAGKGQTAYGTSFPIRNKMDLAKAVKAFGRAPEAKRALLKRFIVRRARALGAADMIPDAWKAAG